MLSTTSPSLHNWRGGSFWNENSKSRALGGMANELRIDTDVSDANGERFSADFESLCVQQTGLTDNGKTSEQRCTRHQSARSW
jgi:hypothetical protein